MEKIIERTYNSVGKKTMHDCWERSMNTDVIIRLLCPAKWQKKKAGIWSKEVLNATATRACPLKAKDESKVRL